MLPLFLNWDLQIFHECWNPLSPIEVKRREVLGVYKTREEAEIMRDKIKKFVMDEIGEV